MGKTFARVQFVSYICGELSIFFSFFDAIFVVTRPRRTSAAGIVVLFHVKKVTKKLAKNLFFT